MKFSPTDIKKLQWSILLLVVLAAIGGGLVFLAQNSLKQAQITHRQAIAQRGDAQTKLSRARDEEREIRDKIDHYKELLERGYIGPEQRLVWVEEIKRLKEARKLIDIQYEFLPQKPVDTLLIPEGPVGGGYEYLTSTMKLQMQLLHEDDLLGFLQDLKKNVQAYVVTRDCHIERSSSTNAPLRGPRPQLKADCTLEWITLREKS
jgi:hypothetical protein